MLELSLIRIDGGTQSRRELNTEVVAEYAEAYRAGVQFPPVIVFYDGKDRWLADGFHRYFGAKAAGVDSIYENITPGTRHEAFVYSLGANDKHGLKRSNADKRHSVELALGDEELAKQSDNAIAKICAVHHSTVSDYRKSILRNPQDAPTTTRTVERNGKTYEQKTANIGRFSAPPAQPAKPAPVAIPDDEVETESQPPEDYTELDAAYEMLSDLRDELVVARMGNSTEEEQQQATLLIAELRAEVKTLDATLRAVTLSRDFYMDEKAQMMRQMAGQRNEINKLKNNK